MEAAWGRDFVTRARFLGLRRVGEMSLDRPMKVQEAGANQSAERGRTRH
jgi:hypothetical protein